MSSLPTEQAKDIFRAGYFRAWNTERPHPLARVYRKEVATAVEWIRPSSKRVLDLGCGPGRFAISYAQAGASLVTAVDISPQVLAAARQAAQRAGVQGRIAFQMGDAENLGLRSSAFDAVSCMQTFVHFPHPNAAAKEMLRACRPGGLFVATATNTDHAWVWRYPSIATVESLLNRFPADLRDAVDELASIGPGSRVVHTDRGLSAPHSSYTRVSFQRLFADAGFTVDEAVDLGRPPVFFLVAGHKPKQ